MTEYVIICLAALLGSGLTLFSGFGLGTILVPVFAIFFPIEIAIILTSIVHFLNNIFKLALLGKNINKNVIIKFGIPSIITAFLGAQLLTHITKLQPIATYKILNNIFYITPVKLTIAILLIIFSLFDILPVLKRIQFEPKYLPIGGIFSGFFGGLSGNQGALRIAFLIRANLKKESFIATGVAIACLIDISRLSIYYKQIINFKSQTNYILTSLATLSAFTGAYISNKLLTKITIKSVQNIVAVVLVSFSILLGLGIV